MADVTVPGTGGTPVTLPSGTGNPDDIAQVIINQLLMDSTGGSLDTVVGGTISGNTTINGPTSGTGLLILSGGGGNLTLQPDSTSGNNWSFVVNNATGSSTITAGGISLVTGTQGGSFNLDNSTIAAAGGNNIIAGTDQYVIAGGADNDTVFALGSGVVSTGSGTNIDPR